MNKSLLTYSLIFLMIVPIFGLNFLISFVGNILLLIFLVPLLIVLIALVSFNSLKSKLKKCDQCGAISLGTDNTCMNCGEDLEDINKKNSWTFKKPSETTIEVQAEEIN